MNCPVCNTYFEPVEYAALGQAMCPVCGEIIDITMDNKYENKELEEEEYEDDF